MEPVTQLRRLTDPESEIIDLYRMLDEADRAFMRGMMFKALEDDRYMNHDNVVRIRSAQQQ